MRFGWVGIAWRYRADPAGGQSNLTSVGVDGRRVFDRCIRQFEFDR